MKIERFEDIVAWQKAQELCLECYGRFRDNKDFGFRDQIQRAAVSVMNNIAEGFERGGDKELVRFLYIAKGSCGEVRSMTYLAKELNYISKETFDTMNIQATEISRMLSGFIKKITPAD